jgi:hypothetical protein
LVATTGSATQVPLLTALVTTAILLLAWPLFLTGALHAHWVVRLLALLLFTPVIYFSSAVWVYAAPPGSPLALAQFGPLALLWLRALWLFVRRSRALPGVTFALALVVVVGFYALGQIYDMRFGYPNSFIPLDAGLLNVHLSLLLTLALLPLLLGGSDFAETAQALGGRIASATRPRRFPWLLPLTTTLVAGGIGAWVVWKKLTLSGDRGAVQLGLDTALALLCFGLLLMAMRVVDRGRWMMKARAVPFAALLVTTLGVIGVLSCSCR